MNQKPDSVHSSMEAKRKIAFVSTLTASPWGGSELLWSQAALRLVREGHAVVASVRGWPERASQIAGLIQAGINIKERWTLLGNAAETNIRKLGQQMLEPLVRQASRYGFARWLACEKPDLICISNGGYADDVGLVDLCLRSKKPCVLIAQANAESWWPSDGLARRVTDIYERAHRVFFVSERNRHLLETQLGIDLVNAEVVRNPCNVRRDASPPWPSGPDPVRLACVGRLEPPAKGQDLLLQVLASEPWCSRPVTVSFFGRGCHEEGLRRLARRLGLDERVRFCGQAIDVESIWASHHALVLPSRYEGLPLTIVEAMLCGRPVIVTDVAGNREVVEDGVNGFIAEAPTEGHLCKAMERAWERRNDWEKMGQNAAKAIRALVPDDPARDFAQRLAELVISKHAVRASSDR